MCFYLTFSQAKKDFLYVELSRISYCTSVFFISVYMILKKVVTMEFSPQHNDFLNLWKSDHTTVLPVLPVLSVQKYVEHTAAQNSIKDEN